MDALVAERLLQIVCVRAGRHNALGYAANGATANRGRIAHLLHQLGHLEL